MNTIRERYSRVCHVSFTLAQVSRQDRRWGSFGLGLVSCVHIKESAWETKRRHRGSGVSAMTCLETDAG